MGLDVPKLDQDTRSYNNQQKKKRNCKIVDFAVSAAHWIKLKEYEKKNKYLDLARELRKKPVESIQTTTLLRTARILRRVLETWRDLL